MTIEQTVEIPADHRLFINVPKEIPTGRALVRLIPLDAENEINATLNTILRPKKIDPQKAEAALKHMRGMFKTDGHDVDRFLEWKQSERDLEYEMERRTDEEKKTWREN
ncbi:MAG: hypothetical protein LBT68_00580 [Spirochaetales bacterium]|jgi:hypothetical protein|nr:hypothetical protein [Spirochaetales bacterium]